MKRKIDKLSFNPSNLDSMIDIMDTYGDDEHIFFGGNENGESVTLSVSSDKITVETYQSNGWVRENTYYRDGTTEELFNHKEEPYPLNLD